MMKSESSSSKDNTNETTVMETGPSTSYQRNKRDNCRDDDKPVKQTPFNTNDPYIVQSSGCFTCNLCNIVLQPKLINIHLKGRRHREELYSENMGIESNHRNLKRKKSKVKKPKRKQILAKRTGQIRTLVNNSKQKLKNSILVKDLPRFLTNKTILEYASKYGNVIQSFIRNDNQYAVLQFDKSVSARSVLENKSDFNRIKMDVVSTNYSDTGPTNSLSCDTINETLMNLPPDYQIQFNHLLEKVQPKWLVDNHRFLCSDLENILQEIFPGCTVFPFGAVSNGLGFTTSVVDLHVLIPTESRNFITKGKENISYYIESAKTLLQKYPLVFVSFPLCDENLKLEPKIECIHIPTVLRCDIYFTKWKMVKDSSAIGYYLSLDSKIKLLIIIIKYWGASHNLIDPSFSNYFLTLLLIFYLQQSPYLLPSIASLDHLEESVKINGFWVRRKVVSADHFKSEALANQIIPELLYGFFNYYATFDYALNVICPYLGKPIPKTDFFKPYLLMQRFRNYRMKKKDISIIFLQDPFIHNSNLTKLLSEEFRVRFIELCRIGADIAEMLPYDPLGYYKLFTMKTPYIQRREYYSSPTGCRFQISMDSHLKHISSEVNKITTNLNPEEKLMYARKIWYNLVNKFIFTILKRIMKFTITIRSNHCRIKCQRLNGQTDVHDNNVIDTVICHCTRSGSFNTKDFTCDKNFLNSINLDEESELVNVIKKSRFRLGDYKFYINVEAKLNPTRMVILLTRINRRDKYFKSFGYKFSKCIPMWFEKYIKELDKNFVPYIKSKKCNCVNCKRKEPQGTHSESSIHPEDVKCLQIKECKNNYSEVEEFGNHFIQSEICNCANCERKHREGSEFEGEEFDNRTETNDTKYVPLVQPEKCNCVNCEKKKIGESEEEEFKKPDLHAFPDASEGIKVQPADHIEIINNETKCKMHERLVPIKQEPLQDDVTRLDFQIKKEPDTEVDVKPLNIEPAELQNSKTDEQTFEKRVQIKSEPENIENGISKTNVPIKTEPEENSDKNIISVKTEPAELLKKEPEDHQTIKCEPK